MDKHGVVFVSNGKVAKVVDYLQNVDLGVCVSS